MRFTKGLRALLEAQYKEHQRLTTQAMQLTGHKTESVYRRYAIVSEADLLVAVERLDAAAAVGG